MVEKEREDKLEKVFELQKTFMNELVKHDKLPEYPVDITSKAGQRLIKEMAFNVIEELAEASFTLKNRMHRLSDARLVDVGHFKEELGDAFAYFVEICILCGISSTDLFEEYKKKNSVVLDRLRDGY